MATKEALVIEDAYLESEDAPALEDVLVYVGENTVDFTTRRGSTITLEFEDLAAINRKVQVAKARKAMTSPVTRGIALGIGLHAAALPPGLRGLYERTLQVEENRALAEQASWQLDWDEINPEINYVTKDENGRTHCFSKPPFRDAHHWEPAPGDEKFPLFSILIPPTIPWTTLHTRPLAANNITYNINITNAQPVVAETLKKALEPERPSWPPDWSTIPDNCNFVAVDANGIAYAYKEKPWLNPFVRDQFFAGLFGYAKEIGYVTLPNGMSWEDSLCERPATPSLQEVLGVDWDYVKPGYNFVAADKDGRVFAYTARPQAYPEPHLQLWARDESSASWDNFEFYHIKTITLPDNLDWRNTLFVRPGYTETQP